MAGSLLRSVASSLRASVPRRLASPAPLLTPAAACIRHARSFNTSPPIIEPLSPSEPPVAPAKPSPTAPSPSASSQTPQPPTAAASTTTTTPAPAPSIPPLLPLLAAQPSHYITIHIHGKPYLVTAGDSVRLPFKMPGVLPGDVLRFDRASTIGSRDFTLKGSPWVESRFFECRATVIGTDSEPMRLKIVKKRRNRRTKTIKSKHQYTTLRISELKVVVPKDTSAAPKFVAGSGIVWQ